MSEENGVRETAIRIYEERLRTDLERDHLHEYVAIEPDSGEYFLGHTLSEAGMKAYERYPERKCFLMRIGHKAAASFGGGW